MIVHKLIKRGFNHPNYCEDFILHEDIDENYSIYGVFDGCSSGIDSHFASALIAKVIRNEVKNIDFNNKSLDEIMELLIFNISISLQKFKKQFDISYNELLSTIVLFLYHRKKDRGKIIAIGDGFLSINGKQIDIDQKNQPDYIGYHIDKITDKISFSIWYDIFVKKYDVTELKDVTISTDGIFSFIKHGDVNTNIEEIKPTDYLTKNTDLLGNKAMLGRKTNILKKLHALHNYDDLGIIRIVK